MKIWQKYFWVLEGLILIVFTISLMTLVLILDEVVGGAFKPFMYTLLVGIVGWQFTSFASFFIKQKIKRKLVMRAIEKNQDQLFEMFKSGVQEGNMNKILKEMAKVVKKDVEGK